MQGFGAHVYDARKIEKENAKMASRLGKVKSAVKSNNASTPKKKLTSNEINRRRKSVQIEAENRKLGDRLFQQRHGLATPAASR